MLQVGDQILDVNGVSFLDISHTAAVQTLKSSKRLVLTIKDVGKIPYAMSAPLAPSASVSLPLSVSVSGQERGTEQSSERKPSITKSSNSTWSRSGTSRCVFNSLPAYYLALLAIGLS